MKIGTPETKFGSGSLVSDSVPEVCQGVPFMTSLEIAELAGMRHDNIMRFIRRELDAIGIAALRFEASYRDRGGRASLCYCLPGKFLLHVLTAFDAKLRFALIEHWEAVNEGWIKPQHGVVNHVVQRLVNGGRKARMLDLQGAEQRAKLDGRRLTTSERNLILLP